MESDKNISTEQKILETAERLFLDKGFALTTTTEIAREAGCNQALVHYYFRTKENLFRQIYEQKMRLFATTFLVSGNDAGTFEEKLHRKIGAHFDMLRKNPKLPFLIVNELLTNPSRIDLFRESLTVHISGVIAQIETELQQEIAQGRIRPISASDLLMNVLSLDVFLFLSLPLTTRLLRIPEKQREQFVEHRKEEIITTVIQSLRP